MNNFLQELHDLLKKHNATIVRSASQTNGLVVSVGKPVKQGMEFVEVEFYEEIGVDAIKGKWYDEV